MQSPSAHDAQARDPALQAALAAAEQRQAALAGRDDTFVTEEAPPLIPPGEYRAVGLDYEFVQYKQFGPTSAKLVVRWQVLVPDPDAEFGTRVVVLARHYNVEVIKKGRYRAPRHGDLAREWMRVTRRRTRRDRQSPNVFIKVLCLVDVATVEVDGRGKPLGEAAYSVVRRVIERLGGGTPE